MYLEIGGWKKIRFEIGINGGALLKLYHLLWTWNPFP